jgi:hypothetical protein
MLKCLNSQHIYSYYNQKLTPHPPRGCVIFQHIQPSGTPRQPPVILAQLLLQAVDLTAAVAAPAKIILRLSRGFLRSIFMSDRIGFFICRCEINIAYRVRVEEVAAYGASFPGVIVSSSLTGNRSNQRSRELSCFMRKFSSSSFSSITKDMRTISGEG